MRSHLFFKEDLAKTGSNIKTHSYRQKNRMRQVKKLNTKTTKSYITHHDEGVQTGIAFDDLCSCERFWIRRKEAEGFTNKFQQKQICTQSFKMALYLKALRHILSPYCVLTTISDGITLHLW